MTDFSAGKHHLELSLFPTSPYYARVHVQRVLEGWGWDDLVDTAQLIVSELVSNAIKAHLAPVPGADLETATPPPPDHIWLDLYRPGDPEHAETPESTGSDGATGAVRDTEAAEESGSPGSPGNAESAQDAQRSGDLVVLRVWDAAGRTPPVLRDPGPDDEGGRGLCLVDLLARSWGHYRLATGGKVVWCTLTAPPMLSGGSPGPDDPYVPPAGSKVARGSHNA
ncbi:ATP-binding protein [Streptosporangium sp. NPDC048047]|uniref:ATP-binding protein n=1 Tax=Streptosporangium sp. NPDC048047 TaxID=3155748 RepID=UPI00342D9565